MSGTNNKQQTTNNKHYIALILSLRKISSQLDQAFKSMSGTNNKQPATNNKQQTTNN